MKILISNDDGHQAEGLLALHQSLCRLVDCVVVAPDRNRSAVSHALTVRKPLRATTQANGFIAVDGTPTDCVHLATGGLLDTPPNMVVSGINSGMNMGDDVLYSGTVAAAVEGRFLDYPAVAFSMSSYTPRHYATGGLVAANLLKQLLANPLPAGTVLNVNIPDVPIEQLKGMRATRLGRRYKPGAFVESHDPRGDKVYWLGPPGRVDNQEAGTDFHAVNNGFVSITPLHIDMTKHDALEGIDHWLGLAE